ncbi:glycosyltransferase [Edwardsiella ictaluri]|uniref:glycosyltransferase n=1 Tax=Edwardsiella ictaluri TaxID=67780 RepID=UPI000E087A2F|nr:glycosyltransferase [Edwardsiella ictaluri]EKS7762437.1 hypothetical protein [Edwardsiella ictaluri]EKS7770834.1 hypothetical protein [Edwardsiella ictaluri]EKS7773978.1 hypothetical protein [Edwardsiella ictaluri]EKS7776052.1 hypothetical protein [Edwardsiella ictaluri]EKS7785957.1 hypothetical protein [Edwardsiella ictaluri]
MSGVGIICTTCSEELAIALATISNSINSRYVLCAIIVVTDISYDSEFILNDKIIIYTRNYGRGFDISVTDGGYDQVSARNFAIQAIEQRGDIEWILQHDADDFYAVNGYEYIVNHFYKYDAVVCSCFTVKNNPYDICSAKNKVYQLNEGVVLYDPHVRIWRRSLCVRYIESESVRCFFKNTTRHCGICFPHNISVGVNASIWHFHLHALLNKRHTEKIQRYDSIKKNIPKELITFIYDLNLK